MSTYGQFCGMARAHEAIGGRWSLLIVREILCGSARFNDIRRGIPRISKTMLSERLQALADGGIVIKVDGARGPEYRLTRAGEELASIVGALAHWGQRWLPRRAHEEDLDADPLFVDMQRRVNRDALPPEPLVARFEIAGTHRPRYLFLSRADVSFCTHNPGFPEPLCVRTPLPALVAWWRGDATFPAAQRLGLSVAGPRALVKAFPSWFDRYLFAHITAAE